MRYLAGLFLPALIAVSLLGCGAGSGVLAPDNREGGFSLSAIDDNPLPDFAITAERDGVRVTLTGNGPAFARISFDADVLRFVEVEKTAGGWAAGEAVVAAFRAGRGIVDFGVAPVRGAANPGANGTAVLLFKYGADIGEERAVSLAPASAMSAVLDLFLTDDAAGGAAITWSYRNQGDYDQNGVVGVPDITPIALNYLHQITGPDDPALPIDGDGDGTIGVPDITPIALNYLRSLTHYEVQFSFDGNEESYDPLASIPRTDGAFPEGGGFVRFEYAHTPALDGFYRVVAFDEADATYGAVSNVVEWRGGAVVSLSISLVTPEVTGSGTESDPYILDQPSPYNFEALQGEEDVTALAEWIAQPEFAVSWSGVTPGETESIIEIAGDFTVYATLEGETSNVIYCRKPIGVS